MAQIGDVLPDYRYPQRRQMQTGGSPPIISMSSPAVVYQLQMTLQYPLGASYVHPPGYVSYPYTQYAPGHAQSPGIWQSEYAPYEQAQHRQAVMAQGPQYTHNPGQYYYYQDAYRRPVGSLAGYSSQHAQFLRVMWPGQPVMPNSRARRPSRGPIYDEQYIREDITIRPPEQQGSVAEIPRGPPRKPKQSGHALWVGNLPRNTTVWALKDHFSQDFTRDIESLFLISKSSCAFVNYRSEGACKRARQKFHDSWFEGVRLVCRLRKDSADTSDVPTGPAVITDDRSSKVSSSIFSVENNTDNPRDAEVVEPSVPEDKPQALREPEQFFIIKSLTLQDLEQSVRNGIWATQSHNEKAFNMAFDSADNVYLIFSANKSGEYFGYARMASSITENVSEMPDIIAQAGKTEIANTTRTIPAPATAFAPRGHVIDDLARGTIFWEAELTDEEQAEEVKAPGENEAETKDWGKPFKIEWISTTRVPFYKTRGLRNPWNANREVKIARDGTKLEPRVGKRLTELFHDTTI